MPQNNDYIPQETDRQEQYTRQNRVCNVIAFVALLAVLLVGGSSILLDAFPKETAVREQTSETVTPAIIEEPMPSAFDEKPSSSSLNAPEEAVIADTFTVELPDTVAVATLETPTDTVAPTLPAEPALPATEQAADSL